MYGSVRHLDEDFFLPQMNEHSIQKWIIFHLFLLINNNNLIKKYISIKFNFWTFLKTKNVLLVNFYDAQF